LPSGDDDFSTRWRLLKSAFSRRVARADDPTVGRRKGERGVWQRKFWEHAIRDERELEMTADYCHYNPVKHGYVARREDWPYSTWRRYHKGKAP
jgi:putative transposase